MALAVVASSPVPTVSGAGMPLNAGPSRSLTVTVWVALAVLPAASAATQVIVVTPLGNGAPSAAPSLIRPATWTAGALSLAVAARLVKYAAHEPGSFRSGRVGVEQTGLRSTHLA